MTELQEFEGLVTQMKDLQAELKAKAEAIVRDGTRAYFEEHGDLVHSFGWNQYVPGFNDGDPCVFSMGELWLISQEDLKEIETEEGPDYIEDAIREAREDSGTKSFSWSGGYKHRPTTGYRENEKPNENYDPRYEAAYNGAVALYNVMSTGNLAEEIFGSNASVIVSPEGVEVDEYYCGY